MSNPFLLWANLAIKTSEMLVSSGQVINHRVGRMATAGSKPSARDRKEFALMGQEKVQAAGESALAVGARMQQVGLQMMLSGFKPWTGARMANEMARMSTAALKPVHRKSTANARRLAKAKR